MKVNFKLFIHSLHFLLTKGVAKLADGKAFADPDVLRRLTSSVSSALDEATAALTRMRTQNNGVPSSPNHTTDAGKLWDSFILTFSLLEAVP